MSVGSGVSALIEEGVEDGMIFSKGFDEFVVEEVPDPDKCVFLRIAITWHSGHLLRSLATASNS
jgi:hypothetical protein